MADSPDTLEIETGEAPVAAVIWLHGLGADARDFEPAVPALAPARAVRFVFPNAPMRPVTINGGAVMRAWFDIKGLSFQDKQDEAGIRASADLLDALIAREIKRGIAAERIVVAGFSQGGAIALHCALRYPQRLAGVIALSTYLPLDDRLEAEAAAANATLPVFMAHGELDPMVPMALAIRARECLAALGYAVEWHSYPMAHAVCPEEVADIRAFIDRVS